MHDLNPNGEHRPSECSNDFFFFFFFLTKQQLIKIKIDGKSKKTIGKL